MWKWKKLHNEALYLRSLTLIAAGGRWCCGSRYERVDPTVPGEGASPVGIKSTHESLHAGWRCNVVCGGASRGQKRTPIHMSLTRFGIQLLAFWWIVFVRNYAGHVSRMLLLILLAVAAKENVWNSHGKQKTSNNHDVLSCGLPWQRWVTGRGSRGGGIPRLSSPLRSAPKAPGRGGGPLPEPGCRSLVSEAQKHPSGPRATNTTSMKERAKSD